VIVSHPDRAARKSWVDVVVCTSQRANRKSETHEILLDSADGLNWDTLCRCDLIYAAPVDELKIKRGTVSQLRRPQLIRSIIAAHGWADVLAFS
jgi:mRNA-degrading endonuclease toxin of MazEF toxin-antitoxin module